MEGQVVQTIADKCVQCFACIRNCPVKAVAIRGGKAEVIQERCIHCGNCVKICSRQAKEVMDGTWNTLQILRQGNAVAVVAPSFPAAFGERSLKLATALKQIGFSQVWEAAVGAELVVQACQKMGDRLSYPAISSFCPSLVNMIERHYPQYIKHLIPIVSPAVATARLIRHKGLAQGIVFIGPCIAKKGEIHHPSVVGDIDEVLTFLELEDMFKESKVDFDALKESSFDSPHASLAYTFPLSGGLLRNLHQSSDLLREDYPVVEGYSNMMDVLDVIGAQETDIKIVDSLFCSGCIDGPGIAGDGNLLKCKAALLDYIRSIPVEIQAEGKKELLGIKLDLTRSFQSIKVSLPQPREKDILEILMQTNKEREEDQLNCGACGYLTCREKAIAVYQDIAERDMCLPFLLSQKSELINSVNEELGRVRELKEDLDILIDASYDGICMTDNKGIIQRVNKNLYKLLDLKQEDLIHKSMSELEKQSILYPSVTMMVLKEKKAVTILQRLKSGKQVLATGNPVMDDMGRISKVISNIRDFDQLLKVKDELDAVYKRSDKAKLIGNNPVIALSAEFTRVLDMARRVAVVDTTVLILGESGVGKEVVACFIHSNSLRPAGPFIKINCGALPESLIESELFGYETGAFTGARSSGKAGLFEMANDGTLFLDEIGELPLSQQVKLLQVIQDKQVTRVGGTKPQKINVRLITATNRNLAEMVKDGQFRADLYYRLNVVPVKIPPLRDRRDDIIPLLYHFLDGFNNRYQKQCKLSRGVREVLLDYPWPGNVRELQNLVERLVVISEGDNIDTDDLPAHMTAADTNEGSMGLSISEEVIPLKDAVEEVEKRLILRAQKIYKNTYKMAEALGINQSTAVRKLNKYLKDEKEQV